MDDLTQILSPHYPRSDSPLHGLTVLVVEDSKYACEGFRLLSCEVERGFVELIVCVRRAAIFRFTALPW